MRNLLEPQYSLTPSIHLPTLLPTPHPTPPPLLSLPLTPSSRNFITKFKLVGINRHFLFYIFFTLFTFTSTSYWIYLLISSLTSLPFLSLCHRITTTKGRMKSFCYEIINGYVIVSEIAVYFETPRNLI